MALLRLTGLAIVLAVAVLGNPVGAAVGYHVKTVFDGNKLGLSFDNLHGDDASVIALDSSRSSLLRVSLPLSQSSVVERISGSAAGKPGYRDGPMNEALFDHPRMLALDSDGNIYVADPKNGAVRMVTKTGLVATIAGGSNRTGHSDGEGSDVTFSTDFTVTYLHSTCTLAVADRGNRMVREIQLPHFIGRCKSGSTPPNSPFTSATLLMFLLVGIAGTVAGVLGTILKISTPQLECWQSRLMGNVAEETDMGNAAEETDMGNDAHSVGNAQGPQLGQLIDLEDDNGDLTQPPPPAAAPGQGNQLHDSLLPQQQQHQQVQKCSC